MGIVAKGKPGTTKTVAVESGKGGLFGMKANAYWESMGVLPLFFAGFGVVALAIKMLKIKGGEWGAGADGVNKAITPKTVITSAQEESELHVFKCGGCGYEMYPARGREFKFFPDSFKCILCGTPKSEFWDLNDPTHPRNQEEEEDEDDDEEGDGNGGDGGGNGAFGAGGGATEAIMGESDEETGVAPSDITDPKASTE